MRKRMIFLPLLLAVLFLLSGYQDPIGYHRKSTLQDNTSWKSADGTISYCVNESASGVGTLIVGDKILNIYLFEDFGRGMYILPGELYDSEKIDSKHDRYEYWECSFKSKEHFVATVIETTFFEIGQKIEFYRVAGQ